MSLFQLVPTIFGGTPGIVSDMRYKGLLAQTETYARHKRYKLILLWTWNYGRTASKAFTSIFSIGLMSVLRTCYLSVFFFKLSSSSLKSLIFVLFHIYLVLGHCTCILLLSFDWGTCNSSSCISSSLAVWYKHIQVQSTVVYQNAYICTYTVRHDFLCHAHSIAWWGAVLATWSPDPNIGWRCDHVMGDQMTRWSSESLRMFALTLCPALMPHLLNLLIDQRMCEAFLHISTICILIAIIERQ